MGNITYDVCKTYPPILVVPGDLADELLMEASRYRSKNRMITMVWRRRAISEYRGDGVRQPSARVGDVAIVRSSQPLVGVMGATSDLDEAIMAHLVRTSQPYQGARRAVIFDARPQLNATANMAKGG